MGPFDIYPGKDGEIHRLSAEVAMLKGRLTTLAESRDKWVGKVEDLKLQVVAYEQLVAQFHIARSGWIHHSNGPNILKKLYKISHGGRECLHTYMAEGVGAAGYRYCIYCGD